MTLRGSTGGGTRAGRLAIRLNAMLEKSLSGYAGAAAAAGVSLLALSPPADAKIVYTPASTPIPVNGGLVPLDLNHDGIADFSFSNQTSNGGGSAWSMDASAKVQGNKVWGRGSNIFRGRPVAFASALRARFEVGPNGQYFQNGNRGLMAHFAFEGNFGSSTYGQWLYTRDRYLGLKFLISGQVHYGWARLSVTAIQPTLRERGFYAILTGYAYETVPNKPIITGKTKGPDVITLEPASLGHLAQGASGISVWREKK
jgi:hypothetical protein